MKAIIKKLVPSFVLDAYHRAMAHLAAAAYGNSSRKMVVIGVTGTNGKTTTCNMIARMLEGAGFTVGMATTANFRIAGKERVNATKMTMLGRFHLQKLLADMVSAGCRYAVIETSSEGIKQHRHAGIWYDVAVFTNLTPEHLESHGGFENYKEAKATLFRKVGADPVKRIAGHDVKKVIVANLADAHGPYFLSFTANKKYGYFVEGQGGGGKNEVEWPLAVIKALGVELLPRGSRFTVRGAAFSLAVPGVINVENALAAVCVGVSQDISMETIAASLMGYAGAPGRLEWVDAGQDFSAVVDYAHEPQALMKAYDALAAYPKKRVIHVVGSAGGGRDKARRPVLGKIAAERADVVIVTNEDPYDEDPKAIIAEVAAGAEAAGKRRGENLFVIEERGAAVVKAVEMAEAGDLVLVTGKGAEQAIVVAGGAKIPWDDRKKIREAVLGKLAARAV